MCLPHPVKNFGFFILTFVIINIQISHAQSLLLIKSNTKVYDTYNDERMVKLKLNDELWVNYQGKQGDFIKISNYFGKDQNYPDGIFTGYVTITSVLDTASRDDYHQLQLTTRSEVAFIEVQAEEPKSIATDIGDYYIGMSKNDALAIERSSLVLGKNKYGVDLTFSKVNDLSEVTIKGESEDALAVDGNIKQQIKELDAILQRKYGKPSKTFAYPSFLEIETNNIFRVASWILPRKTVMLGIGEKNDLYYSVVKIRQN